MKKAIQQAIAAAGSQAKLATDLGVSQQFIDKAEKQGWLPLERAKAANALYGIPLVDLVRDDIASAMRLAADAAQS